jgi:Flp pilus assembly protein TadG
MTRRRSRAGNALIEFAGSLILLSTVFTGVFQIGYAFYTYGALVNAVRAGARYASLQRGSGAADADIGNAVRNLVVYGNPAPSESDKPLVPGLTTADVQLIDSPGASTVSLRGFQIDALFTKIKLNGRPTVTFPVANMGASQ